MRRKISVWAAVFLSCLLLSFSLDLQFLLALALIGGLSALLFASFSLTGRERDELKPGVWIRMVGYIFVYLWEMLKASAAMFKLIATGRVRPGFVRVPTGLRKEWAVTLLSNTITMTPGTFVVDLNEKKGMLYVHWINVTEKERKAIAEKVSGPFERYLGRIK
ncbi:MAG: Na+/H+ antiporter subunit E [Candidatus Hadarchaeales archaeon]